MAGVKGSVSVQDRRYEVIDSWVSFVRRNQNRTMQEIKKSELDIKSLVEVLIQELSHSRWEEWFSVYRDISWSTR